MEVPSVSLRRLKIKLNVFENVMHEHGWEYFGARSLEDRRSVFVMKRALERSMSREAAAAAQVDYKEETDVHNYAEVTAPTLH